MLMASVPDIVIVPATVIGPPVKTMPETVLLALTLVTVPWPVSVLHCGAPAPFDDST